MRYILSLFILWWALPAVAQPPFEINRRYSLVQIGDKGRFNLTYDLSRWAGAVSLRLDVYPGEGEGQEQQKVLRSWTFPGPTGARRLEFKDMPIAVYRFQATLLDAGGQPLAGGDQPVFVEYGGWKAWRRNREAAGPPMQGVDRPDGAENAALVLNPPALLVNAGQSVDITAELQNLKGRFEIVWQLEGQGELKPISNTQAVYRADAEAQAGKAAVIHVFLRDYPPIRANLNVVVTTVKSGDIDRR